MKHTSEEIKYRLSDLGVQIGNIAIDYIAELEKENAELKKTYRKQRNKRIDELQKENADAKEIIKLLLWDLRNRSYEPVKDLERAEQFLSEVEK